MKNTKKLGQLRFLIYQSGSQYIGVCLEFNEVVREESFEKALRHIYDASQGYLETVIKEGLSDEMLNQKAQIKYHFLYYFARFAKTVLGMKKIFEFQAPVLNGMLLA